MKTETFIKGIIEGAIMEQFHIMWPSIPVEAERQSFTIKTCQDFIVHFQKKSPIGGNFFEVYSFRPGREGVYYASRTPRGVIGKVSETKYRSEGLTENYTVDSMLSELTGGK